MLYSFHEFDYLCFICYEIDFKLETNNRREMQTVTIEILNDKAVKLLRDLEQLQLIRVRPGNVVNEPPVNWSAKYKGAMQKQPVAEIDIQLNELRESWE